MTINYPLFNRIMLLSNELKNKNDYKKKKKKNIEEDKKKVIEAIRALYNTKIKKKLSMFLAIATCSLF
jgi:hypothetical protein